MTTWTDPPDQVPAEQPITIPDLIAECWRRFRGPRPYPPNPYEETDHA